MSSVAGWLAELGLPQYAQAFIDNGVDQDVLADLTDADLQKHRRAAGPTQEDAAAHGSGGRSAVVAELTRLRDQAGQTGHGLAQTALDAALAARH